MRKVIVSMNITLDGFMSGPHCELDWHFTRWSADMGESLALELSKTSILLLGRITYQAMAKYWPLRIVDRTTARGDLPFALLVNDHKKLVYTNTLTELTWKNSQLLKGRVSEAIGALKKAGENGTGDIMVYGSGQLVRALIKLDMVDEYQLWVHPVLLGEGKTLFHQHKIQSDLQLTGSQLFESGVILLYYRKK